MVLSWGVILSQIHLLTGPYSLPQFSIKQCRFQFPISLDANPTQELGLVLGQGKNSFQKSSIREKSTVAQFTYLKNSGFLIPIVWKMKDFNLKFPATFLFTERIGPDEHRPSDFNEPFVHKTVKSSKSSQAL